VTALVPAPGPTVALAALSRSHERQAPLPWLAYRHTAVLTSAQILSVIGLTGENLPVGFALGNVDDDAPHTIMVVGEPRDPALAALAGARLANVLDPLITNEVNGSHPLQLWVDGSGTVDFLHAWTFRLRSPWLPGPLALVPHLATALDRAKDAHALLRAILTAAKIPGNDVLVNAVEALNDHFVFPLGGEQEARQLPVLLACFAHAGAPVTVPGLATTAVGLIETIEAAEQVSVSAAADPDWDNKTLAKALASFKRLRRRTAKGNPALLVDPTVIERAAKLSGLTFDVTSALSQRHLAIAQAVRLLRALPALPGLDRRRGNAAYRSHLQLQRGLAHERAWRDFPSVIAAGRDAESDAELTAQAHIDAVRHDRRAFAFAESSGQAAVARVLAVSADGRAVDLELARPVSPRSNLNWWWLDDAHAEAIIGNLEVLGGPSAGRHARLTVTAQMRRLAANPALLTGRDSIRLVCLDDTRPRRSYWPRAGGPARFGAQPAWPTPINFSVLDS